MWAVCGCCRICPMTQRRGSVAEKNEDATKNSPDNDAWFYRSEEPVSLCMDISTGHTVLVSTAQLVN